MSKNPNAWKDFFVTRCQKNQTLEKIFYHHIDKKTKRLKRFFTTTSTKKPNAWKEISPPLCKKVKRLKRNSTTIMQKSQTLEKKFDHHHHQNVPGSRLLRDALHVKRYKVTRSVSCQWCKCCACASATTCEKVITSFTRRSRDVFIPTTNFYHTTTNFYHTTTNFYHHHLQKTQTLEKNFHHTLTKFPNAWEEISPPSRKKSKRLRRNSTTHRQNFQTLE